MAETNGAKNKIWRQAIILVALLFCVVAYTVILPDLQEGASMVAETDTQASALEPLPSDTLAQDDKTVQLFSGEEQYLPLGMEELVVDYLMDYYQGLGRLETQDLTVHFDELEETAGLNAAINQTCLDYLIEVRRAQRNDLTLKNYDIRMEIEEAKQLTEGVWELVLLESNKMNYSFTQETDTYGSGIEHRFTVVQREGNWKILSHSKEEDIYYLVEDAFLAAETAAEDMQREVEADEPVTESELEPVSMEILDPDKILRELLEYGLASIKRNQEDYERYLEEGTDMLAEDLEWDYVYDREGAVAYANHWVTAYGKLRNPRWDAYDDQGGNCNNYISQCLLAGGIPMDATGHITSQWKWYEDYLDSREKHSGRSASWAGVDEFYEYALNNQGSGLVAIVGRNIYSGRIGDIIQYGAGGEWNHSVIIVDVVRDEHGRVLDYLINSNTTDRLNCPMSAYSYTDIRLIRILGYNLEQIEE